MYWGAAYTYAISTGDYTKSTGLKRNTRYINICVTRLVVAAAQCGSIIGKQGSKIKEIRYAIFVKSSWNNCNNVLVIQHRRPEVTNKKKMSKSLMSALISSSQVSPQKYWSSTLFKFKGNIV